MTPQHAKRLLRALADNIAKYEASHGEILDQETAIQGIPMTFWTDSQGLMFLWVLYRVINSLSIYQGEHSLTHLVEAVDKNCQESGIIYDLILVDDGVQTTAG